MKVQLAVAVAIRAFGAFKRLLQGRINHRARAYTQHAEIVRLCFRLQVFKVSASTT